MLVNCEWLVDLDHLTFITGSRNNNMSLTQIVIADNQHTILSTLLEGASSQNGF